MKYDYYINGQRLRDWGVYITQSGGILGLPKARKAQTMQWQGVRGAFLYGREHTETEPRKIRLQMAVIASEGHTALDNTRRLTELLQAYDPETHALRLRVTTEASEVALYEGLVIREGAVDFKFKTGAIAEFTLDLIEINK